ncbi:MAG: NAD-dependent epimerase/dehydratase family protein [Actinomycetota bacterium]
MLSPDRTSEPAHFGGAVCVVTGGLGFIGSNLVASLVADGATVRIVDELVPGHGGAMHNVEPLPVDVLVASIGDPRVSDLVEGADVVFNLAGQVSHTSSMVDPQQDLRLNALDHALFLETLRRVNPTARIVHASTRQVYGRVDRQPVDETTAANPVDVNGVAKLAGEQLHMVYAQAYGMATTSLRLTNVYGPRQRLTSDELGFLPVFMRKALLNETIRIFGDGSQRRDCVHVADVVACLRAATDDAAVGRIYNVGHPQDHSLAEIAALITAATSSGGGLEFVPWPSDHQRIDIGSFHTDSTRINNELGWTPAMSLADGIAHTVAFYRGDPWYLS